MSWSDLERLVAAAESDHELKLALSLCRSRQELLHTARRRGYRVTRVDLHNAWLEHHNSPAAGKGLDGADRWAAAGS
jgi:hypothetical protein